MIKYPKTRIKPVKEKIHGQMLVDDYRWLEDSDSKEVLDWSNYQNKLTTEVLSENTEQKTLRKELESLFDIDSFGAPRYKAGYYYWSERKAGQNQYCVYRSKGLHGKPELLLDVNGRKKDDTVAITTWAVSYKGTYLAYALSENGAEMSTIYIFDLKTGKIQKTDTIPYVKHAQTNWLADDSGFFYKRNPEPGTVPKADEQYYEKIYLHKIGRAYKDDPVIFGEDRHKEDSYSFQLSTDRISYLAITTGRDWVKNDVYLYDLRTRKLRTLVEGIEAQFWPDIVYDKIYMTTDQNAEFMKVLIADIDNIPESMSEWEVFIPERDYKLDNISFTKDKIIASYLRNACSYAEIMDYSGKKTGELELPSFSELSTLMCSEENEEFFYGFTTFLTPFEVYRYDPKTKRNSLFRKADTSLKPEDYVVKQEWCNSKDGARVPMFIVHNKSLKKDGSNPTLLYGYGGFASNSTPSFLQGFIPFLTRGGVFVEANLRGGAEFGENWHRDAMFEKKQNSFDDFIAAAEYLVKNKYTSAQQLAIEGGSNGGLLVGACSVQRPDLFKTVICSVPLLDMVRFPYFLIASRWKSEYGDPEVAKDFEYIIKYSPYHNVKPGVEYPSTLFMTADHDTRVEPLHARKMTALLQTTNQINPVLIRTEIDAGHGTGTPVNKWIDSHSDKLGFLMWQLGMS